MRKILLTMIIAAGISTAALAQAGATATAQASATIVAPITIAKTVDMNFGNIAVHATNPGTVVLSPAGVRTPTDGVTLPTTATGTVTAASFTVSGVTGYTYAITLPLNGDAITITSGTQSMSLTDFISDPPTTGILTSGSETVTVGATLNVTAGQAPGSYTNANAVPVIVTYN